MTATTIPRFNIYTTIHKALRAQMVDALGRVGRLDVNDAAELRDTLARLDALMTTCDEHLAHENAFLHTAIEARAPQGSRHTAGDHVEHAHAIARLRRDTAALRSAEGPSRDALALALYGQLALFVADNFQHMHVEETRNVELLWAHYTDAEIFGIHHRLVASLTPQQNLDAARWMVPAMTPFERVCMFKGMQQSAPPEAVLGVMAFVRPHLGDADFGKLSRALGVGRTEPALA